MGQSRFALFFTSPFDAIESQFAVATPPRAGSTSWYDACDLLASAVKGGLRARFGRSFHTEVYGAEVGLIVRVRGEGCGARPSISSS